MTKLFKIAFGGAGKILCSIPSFLKYYNNTSKDFYIQVPAWEEFFLGYPELQEKVYTEKDSRLFENVYSKVDEVVQVEPYLIPKFYMGQMHIMEAYDSIINPGDASELSIYIPSLSMDSRLADAYMKKKNDKELNVVIQPYGSTMSILDDELCDESHRSIPAHLYKKIVDTLSEHCNIFYMGDPDFHRGVGFNYDKYELNLRTWVEIIRKSDYFIGCDSVGQHIAKFTDTPSSVLFAGTSATSYGYEGHHNVEKDIPWAPTMLGILNERTHQSYHLNQKRIEFNIAEEEFILSQIKQAFNL